MRIFVRDTSCSDRLYELLITEIRTSGLEAGDRFYSERELSLRHGVARLTARRVIQRLVSHGCLRQEAGRGTFVTAGTTSRPKTRSILLVSQPLDPHRSLVELHAIALLQTIAAESGYHIVLASSRRSEGPHTPPPYQVLIEKQRADGVILHSVDSRVHRWFSRRGDPVVVIGSSAGRLAVPQVRCHDESYYQTAVARLAELRHQRVAFLAKRPTTEGSRLRAASFEKAVEHHGLQNAGSCFYAGDEEGCCGRIVRRLVGLPKPPTAIVTARITQAARVLAELSRTSLKVPEDISVLSGWDAGVAHLLNPKVTTMDEPIEEMLRCAWEMLLEQSERGNLPRVAEKIFEPALTMRESVAKARHDN